MAEGTSSVADRKFRPRWTSDIAKTVEQLQPEKLRERASLIEIVGSQPSSSAYAWYFRGYERLDVHRTMINDAIRTGSYLMAICRNHHVLKNKTILDVGTGIGILSIFAVKDGLAKRAIAVDASGIAEEAELLVKSCGLDEKITVIRDRIEDLTELPDDIREVDVIVSEWMGYSLFNESMLNSVITARKRFLKDGGFMIPDTAVLRMIGSSAVRPFPARNYETKMKAAFAEANIKVDLERSVLCYDQLCTNMVIKPKDVLTNAVDIKVVDMYRIQPDEVKVDSQFMMECNGHGFLRSFVIFFDVLFDLPNSWMFSTSPESPRTHWGQTVCALAPDEHIEVWRGTTIFGRIRMTSMSAFPRCWTIHCDYTVKFQKKSDVASRSRVFYLL
ncbi:hypothetical protein RvY_03207 [Ramazzottius varieornatus]|uniref:Protein arginine N-methyltransferase 6 n=1 Tax=Ramazzottius varieornatus TaxID=947166 RepID=A0A1D1UUB0_RAMVA|nr:hypothetical protein RvY_03207 [Ramazzottius varieornatus]